MFKEQLSFIHISTFKSSNHCCHSCVYHKSFSTATKQQRRKERCRQMYVEDCLYFPNWKKPKSTLCEYSHTVCFLWENLTSRKGIGRFIWLIPNSCLIAAALCCIRVWWAAQSQALEEWKIKHISWSKIPFIVLMISQSEGICPVEEKRYLE